MKLRGKIKPHPQYTADLRGLREWLGQPPSSFSAVGWQNAKEWLRVLDEFTLSSIADVVTARRERDEARRMYCRTIGNLTCVSSDSVEYAAMQAAKVAETLGWDCFRDDEGEVSA